MPCCVPPQQGSTAHPDPAQAEGIPPCGVAPLKILHPRGQPTQNGRARVEHAVLKCNFIAITNEADVQDFSEHVYEVAGPEQPIDISDDDEAVAEMVCD